jgi:hypothetical protein
MFPIPDSILHRSRDGYKPTTRAKQKFNRQGARVAKYLIKGAKLVFLTI